MISHSRSGHLAGRAAPIAAALAGLGLLGGCASTRLEPLRADGGRFELESDEQALWSQAHQIDVQLERDETLYRDEALESHLDGLARRLARAQLPPGSIRVRIVKTPLLNAFALPNGSLYVTLGMLARLESDSQLATILGHELSHFERRHALREQREKRNQQTAITVVGTVLGVVATAASADPSAFDVFRDLTQLAGTALGELAIAGYSRDLEREADRDGLDAMRAGGFRAAESVFVFELLRDEIAEEGIEEPTFYGTHPRLEERIESYREELGDEAGAAGPSESGEGEYLERMKAVVLENARMDVSIGRISTALRAADRYVDRRPADPEGHVLRGEIHRRSWRDAASRELSLAAYHRALELRPDHPQAQLELGLLCRASGDPAGAREHLRAYLDLAPEAVDRPIVQLLVAELETTP